MSLALSGTRASFQREDGRPARQWRESGGRPEAVSSSSGPQEAGSERRPPSKATGKQMSLLCLGSLVLLLFNFALLASGLVILTTCFLPRSPAASVIRTDILSATHVLNIMFYSLVGTTSAMCIVAMITSLCVCCCRGSARKTDFETRADDSPYETEILMLNRLRDDPELELGFTSEFLQSTPHQTLYHNLHSVDMNGDESKSKESNHHQRWNGIQNVDHGNECKVRQRTSVTRSSTSSSAPLAFCFLIFSLLLLVTIQLTIAFLGFVAWNEESVVRGDNETSFIDALLAPSAETRTEFLQRQRSAFDKIEQVLKCCGLIDYSDYEDRAAVPDSCCLTPTAGCGRRKHPSNIFYEGCNRQIQRTIVAEVNKLSCLSLGFSAVAGVGFILACYCYVRLVSEHSLRTVV